MNVHLPPDQSPPDLLQTLEAASYLLVNVVSEFAVDLAASYLEANLSANDPASTYLGVDLAVDLAATDLGVDLAATDLSVDLAATYHSVDLAATDLGVDLAATVWE